MDVKFITVTRELFPTVPVIDGQVISIYDETGFYYDTNSTRHSICGTITAETLEDVTNPEEGILYAIYSDLEGDKGAYVYQDGQWICLAETYTQFIGATEATDGGIGLVPGPKIGERGKYLRGDGVWSYTPYPAWNRDYGDDDDDEPEGYDVVDDVITPDSKNPVASSALYTEFMKKQDEHKASVYTLVSSNWNSTTFTQKLTIDSDSADDAVFISPTDDSINLYINYEIQCTEQGDDYLVFHCGLLPTSDINLNIAILHYVDLSVEESTIDEEVVSTARALSLSKPVLGLSQTAGEVDPVITPDSKNPVMSSAIYAALLLKQNQHTQAVAKLAKTAWNTDDNTLTVRVPGVSDQNLVFIAPDVDSYKEYLDCSIKCIKQTTFNLTFDCATIPSNDLDVNVVILD